MAENKRPYRDGEEAVYVKDDGSSVKNSEAVDASLATGVQEDHRYRSVTSDPAGGADRCQTSDDGDTAGEGPVRMPATEPPVTFDGAAYSVEGVKGGDDRGDRDSMSKRKEQLNSQQAAASAAFERSKRKAAEGAAAVASSCEAETAVGDRGKHGTRGPSKTDDVAAPSSVIHASSRNEASAGVGGVVTVQVQAQRSHFATAMSAGGGGGGRGIAEMEANAARSHFDAKRSPSAAAAGGTGLAPPELETVVSSPGAVAVPGYRAGEIDTYRHSTDISSSIMAAPPPRQQVREMGSTDEETAMAVVTATAVVHRGDHEFPPVAATAAATGPVVQAKALDDNEIRALEGSKPEVRLRRKRRRRFWIGVGTLIGIGVVIGVAVPLTSLSEDRNSSTPAPPAQPRPTTCEGYAPDCISTYEELVNVMLNTSAFGTPPQDYTVAAICNGSDIVVERELVVQRDNLTVCCVGGAGFARGTSCTLRGGDAQLRQILQVAGNNLHLLGVTFDMRPPPNATLSPRPEGTRNGNVNVNGAGHHIVEGCTFVGGVAVELASNGGNFNLDGLGRANLTVTRSVFGDAVAEAGGGGVFLTGLDHVEFDRCIFEGNDAGYGGGFAATQLSTISIHNSTFRGNNATGKGGAGWIRASDGHVIVNNEGVGNEAANCDLIMDTVSGHCLDFDGNVVSSAT